MLYAAALCYVALVFFRPAEVILGLGDTRLVLGASVAIAPVLVVRWWRRAALPIELPHDRWLLAYWLAIGASNVASGWLGGAALGVEQFAQVVFLYFLLRTAITTPEQFRTLVIVLTAAMLFHAVGAIVQYHTGVGWGGVTPFIERRAPRSQSVGIFHDPNALAGSFLLVLPFLFAGVFGRVLTLRQRLTAAATAIPILLAFYYANSRGAMLGLAASVCVYSWRRFGSVLGAPVAVLALVALVALAPSRAAMMMSFAEPSAQGRIQAWAAGLEMVKESPITGVGWNRYMQYHERPAHNSFLQAFAELGLLGGWCFVAMVYSFFWGLGLTWRKDTPAIESLSNWEHALTSAGAGFFVAAFFLSQQYSVITFTVLALGAIYLAIVVRAQGAPAAGFARQQWLAIATATAAILVAIWISVRLLMVRSG